MDLKNKVVLITGAVSGYGREFCIELYKQGSKLSICDINTESSREFIQQLIGKQSQDNNRVIFCPCDVTDYPQFEEAFQTTINKLGTIDIVINNASVMNDKLWELEVDVNLNGIIRGLLLATRHMTPRPTGGLVVNVTSSCVAGRPLLTSLPVYAATQQAVAALTRCWGDQSHVTRTGLRVVAMCTPPHLLVTNASSTAVSAEVARKRLMSADYEGAWQRDVAHTTPLKADYAAKALVEIIKKAPSGTSWLVENSKSPTEILLFT